MTTTPVRLPYDLQVDQVAAMTPAAQRAFLDRMQAAGACRTYDPEKWFPLASGAEHATQAVRICQGCPLRAVCLSYALASHTDHGVWGGYTDRQRRPWLRAVSTRRKEIAAEAKAEAKKEAATAATSAA